MIDVKILAKDKKEGGSGNGTNTYTPAYIPPELSVKSINVGDAYLRYDESNKALYVSDKNGSIMNFYAIGGIAALGQYSDKGKGEMNYDRLDAWQDYDASKAGYVLAAGLGYELNTRITALENGVIEGVATEDWVIKQGYLTAHQSLAGYATQNWVQQQGYLTSHQSLLDYATKAWTNNNFASKVHTHAIKVNGSAYTINASGSVDLGSYLPLNGGTMTNTNVVTNLNADLLDGLHLNRVVGTYTRAQIGTSPNFDNPSIQNGLFEMRTTSETTGETGTRPFNNFAPFLTLKVENVMMQLTGNNGDGWYIRGTQKANVTMANTPWQQLARTTDNVASATKLQTARTLWGQSFDGTDNVSGNLTFMTGSNGMYGIVPNQYGHWDLSIYTEGKARLTIKDDGSVGIGTSNPTEKLDVVGNVRVSCNEGEGLRIKNLDGKYSAIKFADSTGTDKAAIHYFHADMRNNPSANTLNLQSPIVSLGDWQNPTVYVNSANNFVGIKTTPQAELDVNGNALIGGILYISTGGYHESVSRNMYSVISVPDNYHKFILRGDVTTTAQNSYTTGDVTTFAEWGGNWRFRRLTESENTLLVELGATSTFHGTIHTTGDITADGGVSSLRQSTSSDLRLKDKIDDLNLSIDMFANAPSIRFRWKNKFSLGEQVGTIAQYWQANLPEVVHELPNGYFALQYDVAALLGVITATKRVKNHENRIKKLEDENKKLKEEIKKLKGK